MTTATLLSCDEWFRSALTNFSKARLPLATVEKAEGHDPEVEELLAYIAPLLAIEFYEEVRARAEDLTAAIRNVPHATRAQMGPNEALSWGESLVLAFFADLRGYVTTRGQRAIVGGARYLAAGGAAALGPAAGTEAAILEALGANPASLLGAAKDYASLLQESVLDRSRLLARTIETEIRSVAPNPNAIARDVTVGSTVVTRALDQWVYRWRNVGAAIVAQRLGKTLVAFNNPPFGPDARTSSFCRWVHGRKIDPRALDTQVRRVRAGRSPEGIREAWPFVGNFSVNDGPEEFLRRVNTLMPEGLGLPPYHFGCRTQVRVVA